MNRAIITSKGAPPSLVCFSFDNLNHEDDDRSELTGPSHGGDLSQEDDARIKLRRGFFPIGSNGNGGSMQLLADTNAKLVADNARLQVVIDVTRRSLQSYIKDSRRCSDKDKQTIKTLQQENELLHQRLSVSANFKLSFSERTAKTSLESSFTEKNQEDFPVDSSQHSTQDSMLTNSLHSIPEQEFRFGTSGDDWTIEGEEIEATSNVVISERAAPRNSTEFIRSKETVNTFANRAASSKSADLLVEFGETEIRRPRRTNTNRSHSRTEETASRKSENLLVEFSETRRARSVARTWSSLKL